MTSKLNINWLNKCRCGNRMHTVETVRGSHVRLFEDDAVKCKACGREGVIQTCDGIATVLWETDEERAEGAAMNKSTITRARLEEIRDYDTCVTLEESAELARMALAAMDSEPVAWMHNNNDIGMPAITVSQKIGHYWMAEFENVQPLYRHAQPALIPYAWSYDWACCVTCEGPQDFEPVIEREPPSQWSIDEGRVKNLITLYRTAQPAPVVPDYFASLVAAARVRADKAIRKFPQPNYVLNKVAEESGEVIKAVIHYTEGREEWSNVEAEIIDNLAMLLRLVKEGDQVIGFTPPVSCRAAMLQAQSDDDGEPTDDERIMAIEGIHNCERCGDEGWVVGEMGITRCACGQAGNSPVIGIDPASGPDRTVEVRYFTPPGYVMVPREPTDDMCFAPDVLVGNKSWDGYQSWADMAECKAIYEAMLAAAPTGIPINSNGWIPVSERMPEDSGTYQVWNGKHVGAVPFLFGSFQCLNPEQVTHWMPTAKPPLEMKP